MNVLSHCDLNRTMIKRETWLTRQGMMMMMMIRFSRLTILKVCTEINFRRHQTVNWLKDFCLIRWIYEEWGQRSVRTTGKMCIRDRVSSADILCGFRVVTAPFLVLLLSRTFLHLLWRLPHLLCALCSAARVCIRANKTHDNFIKFKHETCLYACYKNKMIKV